MTAQRGGPAYHASEGLILDSLMSRSALAQDWHNTRATFLAARRWLLSALEEAMPSFDSQVLRSNGWPLALLLLLVSLCSCWVLTSMIAILLQAVIMAFWSLAEATSGSTAAEFSLETERPGLLVSLEGAARLHAPGLSLQVR